MYYGHISHITPIFDEITKYGKGYRVRVLHIWNGKQVSKEMSFSEASKLLNALTVKPIYTKNFTSGVDKYNFLYSNEFVKRVLWYQ